MKHESRGKLLCSSLRFFSDNFNQSFSWKFTMSFSHLAAASRSSIGKMLFLFTVFSRIRSTACSFTIILRLWSLIICQLVHLFRTCWSWNVTYNYSTMSRLFFSTLTPKKLFDTTIASFNETNRRMLVCMRNKFVKLLINDIYLVARSFRII